jgi:hypothetical protein
VAQFVTAAYNSENFQQKFASGPRSLTDIGALRCRDPGHGRRLQIRDKHRRIIGYIERDGDITDKSRRKVGGIEKLLK